MTDAAGPFVDGHSLAHAGILVELRRLATTLSLLRVDPTGEVERRASAPTPITEAPR
jgi:hypothetical protein